MVNLFKKGFIYLALIMLALVSIGVENASAAEVVDYEEGVTNLNNTPENSAVIGSRLLKPEIGWKRYDDRAQGLLYTSKSEDNYSQYFKSTQSYINIGSKLIFKFKGTKIRLIGAKNTSSDASTSSSFIIDGKAETFDQYGTFTTQILLYEKSGLEDTIHTVEIIPSDLKGKRVFIDAIEVDGFLLNPIEESITLDKNNLELFEGSQDKLIATVIPDTTKVIWTSSDDSIATVDQDGNVTAISEGQAIITATIENTEVSATSTVIVKKPDNSFSSAILSITLVNGITKEYDVTNTVLNNYLNWFESTQGTSTFKFSKTISPYKKVTEYIVHDKIASFEVREY